MRRYRLELVCESGEGELEEAILRTSADVARALRPTSTGSTVRNFVVVLLDAKHRPIGVNTVSLGSLTSTVVHPVKFSSRPSLAILRRSFSPMATRQVARNPAAKMSRSRGGYVKPASFSASASSIT